MHYTRSVNPCLGEHFTLSFGQSAPIRFTPFPLKYLEISYGELLATITKPNESGCIVDHCLAAGVSGECPTAGACEEKGSEHDNRNHVKASERTGF